MPTNEFLPFATGVGANVITTSTYSGDPARTNGFSTGTAEANHCNKVWRQGSIIASMIGQFIALNQAGDVLDDGNIAALEAQFEAALRAFAGLRRAPTAGTASAATITFTVTPPTTYTGLVFLADVTTTLNAAATMNVNALGAKNLLRDDGTSLQKGDMPATGTMLIAYDGTALRVLNLTAYAIQTGSVSYGLDTSSNGDTLTVDLVPAPLNIPDGFPMDVIKGVNTNFLTTPTISINSSAAMTLVRADGSAVYPGDLPGGCSFRAVKFGSTARIISMTPQMVRQAAIRRTRIEYDTPGVSDWTVPTNVTLVSLEGNSAGGGGGFGTTGTPSGAGSGGGGGSWGYKDLPVLPGDILTVTIPLGGTAATAGANAGNGATLSVAHKRGGTTLANYSLGGGLGGTSANAGVIPNSVSGGAPGSGWDKSRIGQPSKGGFLAGSSPSVAGDGGLSINGGFGGSAGTGAGNPGLPRGGGGAGSATSQVSGPGANGGLTLGY